MCDCSQSTTMTLSTESPSALKQSPTSRSKTLVSTGSPASADEALASAEGCVDADGATLRSATLGVTSSEADWQPASAITTTITSAAEESPPWNGHVSSNPRLMWTCP